jgi:hypothetical protein
MQAKHEALACSFSFVMMKMNLVMETTIFTKRKMNFEESTPKKERN